MDPFDYITEKEVVELTQALVRQQSDWTNPTYEKPALDELCRFLDKESIPYTTQEIDENRYNIIVGFEGQNPGKTLLLNGHLDTVPAYEMDFPSHEAFLKEGWIYGRGTNDMKGSVAAMIMTVVALRRSGKPFSGNVIVSAVCGEEDDSVGTKELIKRGIKADAAIVGEPSGFDYAVAHRGLEWMEITIEGKTAHSGVAETGINAISKAAKIITALENELEPLLQKRTSPYSGRSILNFGKIEGGDQPSTVAGQCTIQLDRRYIDGETPESVFSEIEEILKKVTASDPDVKASLKLISHPEDDPYHNVPLVTDAGHPVVSAVRHSVEKVTGRSPDLSTKRGWTDAGLLSYYANIPTVVCGPGDITYSHAENEAVAVSQLTDAVRIYTRTALSFCGHTNESSKSKGDAS